MTKSNAIDVYFHMKNHYKKLKQVKSVTDCACPKGRSKSKLSRGSSTQRSDVPSRPQTRRNIKDTPTGKTTNSVETPHEGSHDFEQENDFNMAPLQTNQVEEINYAIADTETDNLRPVESITKSSEQHEYLQFSLRITEDIINNDLYSNEQMRDVLRGHYEANKFRLDAERMKQCIFDLCRELNIVVDDECFTTTNLDCIVSKDNVCICPNLQINADNEDAGECECLMERKPPIECAIHPIYDTTNQLAGPKDITILHEVNNENFNKSPSKNSAVVELPYDNYIVSIKKCVCNADSCNSSTCLKSDETVNVSFVYDHRGSVIELANSHVATPVPIAVEEKPPQEENVVIPQPVEANQPQEPDPAAFCPCTDENDKMKAYVKYFDDTTQHIKHLRELEFSHFTTIIQPPPTIDFSVQTTGIPDNRVMQSSSSQTTTPPTVRNQYTTTNLDSQTEDFKCITLPLGSKIQSDNRDDYIILSGPVYVPKHTATASKDILALFSSNNNNYNIATPTCFNQGTMAQLDYDMDVCGIANKGAQVNIAPHDYDMTPQKDTIQKQYSNAEQCSCRNKSSNLLLGNNYNMYQSVNEHMSCFYPTIATQVSSMELLTYETYANRNPRPPSYEIKDDEETLQLQKTSPKRVSISVRSDSDEDADGSKANSTYSSRKGSTEIFESDIFKKLDCIPELENTISMHKRMESLKSDMEKFREGTLDTSPRNADYNSPRAINIQKDVELIMAGTPQRSNYELRSSPKKGASPSRPKA